MEYAYVYTYVSISLLQFNNNNEENDYARMALLRMFVVTENIYKLLPSCYHQCCVHANLRPSII